MYRVRWTELVQLLISNKVSSQVLSETIQHLTRQVMCFFFVWSGHDFSLLCRQESAIKRIETEHYVHVRWESQMEEYQEAMKIATIGKQQVLKDQMMTAVREKVFYLATLKHHAGIVTFNFRSLLFIVDLFT